MNAPQLPKTSPLAIWSLVLGIVGIACCGLAAIPAIICGHMALSRVKASGGVLQGGGQALAGLIMGYVGTALMVITIPLLAAIAIPNFIKARDAAQTKACINNLRQIDGAKQQWAMAENKDDAATPAAEDLAPAYIPAMPTCPKQGIYTIGTVGEDPTCSVEGHSLPSLD